MPDKLASIALSIISSWENWLEKNSQPEIDFYTKMYSRSQAPKVVTQPNFLSSTFNMVNLQLDYQNLLMVPWPFSGNCNKSQDQFFDTFSEMDTEYISGRKLRPSAFTPIQPVGVHKDLQPWTDLSNQTIGRSSGSYLSSKNSAPFEATKFDEKSENNNYIHTEKKDYNNRNITQSSEGLREKKTLNSKGGPKKLFEREEVDHVRGGPEKNKPVRTENQWTQHRDRYSQNTEDPTNLGNRPDSLFFEQRASRYSHPKLEAKEDKNQHNSLFSRVRSWGELAERLNDKSSSESRADLTSSEIAVSSIITADVERSVPEVSEKSRSIDTYSTLRNLSAIGKEINTKHLPFTFTDMAIETPSLSESETLLPDTEELYEALAAKLRREYNRYYGP